MTDPTRAVIRYMLSLTATENRQNCAEWLQRANGDRHVAAVNFAQQLAEDVSAEVCGLGQGSASTGEEKLMAAFIDAALCNVCWTHVARELLDRFATRRRPIETPSLN